MLIRVATTSDLAAVWAVERAVFGEEVYPAFFFRQALDLWGELLLVAELAEGEVVGYALGAPSLRPGEGWVVSAAVLPAHRGGGVATRLTRALLDACAGRGMREVRLTVHPGNAAAVALYRKLGFDMVGEEADYFGPAEPRLVMRIGLLAEQVWIPPGIQSIGG